MGRPSFVIDQARLRALRKEKGLTQAALATKAAQVLKKPATDALVRHYQRIEETGRTSTAYAKALANILGVSVPLLQGHENPDPYAYRQYVEALLKGRLEAGGNQRLQDLLARHERDDKDNALRYLAEDIAEHIEQVLLVRNPTMIRELVELTGLSETDLLAPANARGFWFLSAKSRVMNCSELVDGVASLNYRVGEILHEYLSSQGRDSIVRMWHDSPWVRIEINRPAVRDRMLIDVTRCQPDDAGLRWIAPSWIDDFFLESALTAHAYANADVVSDFTGRTAPADPRGLRLIVTEHDGTYGKVLRRMVVKGGVDQMPERLAESFARDCSTRVLFMNWLTGGLKQALTPHLAALPASSWQVRVNGNGIEFSRKDPRFENSTYAELQYRIVLSEQTAHDVFEAVPVRARDLDQLRQQAEEWLGKGQADVDAAADCADFEVL